MNPSQTQISVRAVVVPCYVRGQANTASIEIERSAADLTVTSATYSLLDATGTAVVDAQAATIAAGSASYALTTTHLPSTLTPEAGWSELWVIVYSGQTYRYQREVVIGQRAMLCPISDTDLQRRFSRIAAQSSDRVSWQEKIDEAFTTVLTELIALHLWPQRILSPSTIRPIVLAQAIVLILDDMSMQQANRGNYAELAKSYRDQLAAAWTKMTVAMDNDEDGVDDSGGTERTPVQPAIVLRGAPPAGFSSHTLQSRGF